MKNRLFVLLSIALIAVLASACSTPAATPTDEPEPQIEETVGPTLTPTPGGGQNMDFAEFVSTFENAGYTVKDTGTAKSGLFTGDGHIVTINDVEAQVFEYADAAALEEQAGKISENGSEITGPEGIAIVDWVDMPHFFKKGRILVVYVGRDQVMLGALETHLGPRFAGGSIEAWGDVTPIAPGDGSGLGGMTADDLRLSLEAAGATVTEGEVIEGDLFSVKGKVLVVNGVNIDVFEFPTAEAAAADAATIHAGGSMIGERVIDYFGPPNYYQAGKLLVLYVGTDESMLSLLEQFLGKPLTFES